MNNSTRQSGVGYLMDSVFEKELDGHTSTSQISKVRFLIYGLYI